MIKDEEAGRWDRRVLDVQQVRPLKRDGGERIAVERVDLRPAVWVLVLGLFLLERIKANRYEQA